MTKLSGFKTRRWTTAKGQTKCAYYFVPSRLVDPKRKEIPLGTDYTQALKKYADLIGTDFKPKVGSLDTVFEMFKEWMENEVRNGNLSQRTLKDRIGYWKKLSPVFGHLEADAALEPHWFLHYFEQRSSQVSAKKELKAMSVMLNWAIARNHYQGVNPLIGGFMRQLKVQEVREIYVEDNWYYLTYKHSAQFVKDAMDACLLFTFRPDECEAARMKDIEGNELKVSLSKTKRSGLKEKRIPIRKPQKAYIDRQRSKSPRPMFLVSDERGQKIDIDGSKFRRAFKRARDNAQAEADEKGLSYRRFQLRDLRAKSATDIARDFGIEAARLCCGHTTQKQTSDYIRSIKGAANVAFGTANGGSGFTIGGSDLEP